MTGSNALYRLRSYARHKLTAWHTGGEGVHSPALFYVVRMVIYDDNAYYAFPLIERQRARLLHSTAMVQQEDYGTGARARDGALPQVTSCCVADIARMHLASPKVGQLLFRLVNHLTATQQEPLTIVELGTSLGITTAYLASPGSRNSVLTFDDAEDASDIALDVWRELELKNIQPVIGSIDDTLQTIRTKRIDLAYIHDAYTYEATMRFFRQLLPTAGQHSIFVIGGIHHSAEMEHAWLDIQDIGQVTSTIDCYDVGVVFFNKHYMKKHYKIRI